ncbi:MAG: DUF533 domain-containing protein [Acidobacteria bacterium]|nr:MAG: DUF533 domain-containing protein [Acidobacteriota bacterium]
MLAFTIGVMAFLDRFVSDIIKKSTGFNARSIVRTVGGQNILLLGGAALAAALAAEKMGGSESPPQPPVPLVPNAAPPPLPTAPPPPPLPPPQELLFAIVRTMVAASLADGQQHDDEKELINKRLGESGLSLEQIQQVHTDLATPPAFAELAALVDNAHDSELLYRFSALVVLADDNVSDGEKAWLAELAKALGIDAARRQVLDGEIFEST